MCCSRSQINSSKIAMSWAEGDRGREVVDRVFAEREFFIDNLLVRIHRCFWWTGLAPWEFEFPFPILTSI